MFALYGRVRDEPDHERAWNEWRRGRDGLFATHSQSPLPSEARAAFSKLRYHDYDASLRVLARVEPVDPERVEIAGSAPQPIAFRRFAVARFELAGAKRSLELYWLEAYGGGVFLPFADDSTGRETYGGGRYLLDTVKGADLGTEDGRLVLDFNFAYNPSCAYDARWACPLSPAPNRLEGVVRGGERAP